MKNLRQSRMGVASEINPDVAQGQETIRNNHLHFRVWRERRVSFVVHAAGVSSETSAALSRAWGAHGFGTLACGTWAHTAQSLIAEGRLSINPLELLASAATVVLLEKIGKLPSHKQVSLCGENSIDCNAANTGIAYSPAMRFALGIFVGVCRKARVRCWIVYIGTKDNRRSDLASRLQTHKAEEAVRRAGWEPEWLWIEDMMKEWERQLHQWANTYAI